MKKFKKPEARHRPHSGKPQGFKSPGRGTRGGPVRALAANQAQPVGRTVVGIHAVRELLKVRANSVSQLWLRENYEDHPDLLALFEMAKRKGIRIQTQGAGALDRIVPAHQGIIAFSESEPEANWSQIEASEKCVLIALDEVEDPHNLGAILRTAWLFGAKAVLTPEHRSAHLSPAVSKVAQGAVEHIPVERESALPERLKRLKESGFWILGLSHESKQSIYQLEIPLKVVWVLGSESSGLRKSVEGACDDLIAIPQVAPEASYNVSVAAAVALSETFRQMTQQS